MHEDVGCLVKVQCPARMQAEPAVSLLDRAFVFVRMRHAGSAQLNSEAGLT